MGDFHNFINGKFVPSSTEKTLKPCKASMRVGEKSGIGGADGKHGVYEFLQTHVVYLQRY
jgi:hypothetical protein